MTNSKIIPLNTAHLLRLKRTIELHYDHEKDEILFIIFSSIINTYPNQKWLEIEDAFFAKLPKTTPQSVMIYTILAFKLELNFLNSNDEFIYDLILSIVYFEISPHKLEKYAKIFLEPDIYPAIIEAQKESLIKPRLIFKIAFEYLKNHDFTPITITQIKEEIRMFINMHKIELFNGNYYFFNIYHSLKKLITLSLYPDDSKVIELIPLFNTIPSEEIKNIIKRDFAFIEKSSKPLLEKIKDCIDITSKYSYELPLANEELKL